MQPYRSIFEAGYDTAHTDGWRLRVKEEGGEVVFRAAFLVAGAEAPAVPAVELRRLPAAAEADVIRATFLMVALVRYMNMGGSAAEGAMSALAVLRGLAEVRPAGLELVAVTRSRPPTVVWRDQARGEYLRVVEGDFSELLDPDEVEDLVGETVPVSVPR